jgi:peroxiredoxin
MNNIKSKIEFSLNIVVVIAIVIVAVVIVRQYVSPLRVDHGGNTRQRAQALVGTRLTVTGVDWRQNKKSVVFFLQKDCPACKIAAPFYRQLIDEASRRDVKRLAILPDPLEEGQQYVRSLDLRIDGVQSAELSSYKITSIPTVLYVNSDGVVKGAWIGAAPDRENETRTELVALLEAKGP